MSRGAACGDARAWLAVHEAVAGGAFVVVGSCLVYLTAGHSIEGVGPVVRFSAPVPLGQLLAAVLAVGAALMLTSRVDPRIVTGTGARRRLRRGRAVWSGAVLVGAVMAGLTGLPRGGAPEVPSLVANILLMTGLAVVPVAWRWPEYAWLPPTALVLVAAVFGSSDGESYRWWASLLAVDVGGVRWAVSAGVTAVGLGTYVIDPRSHSGLSLLSRFRPSTARGGGAAASGRPPRDR